MNTESTPDAEPTTTRRSRVWVGLAVALAAAVVVGVVLSGHRAPMLRALRLPHEGAPRLVVDKELVDFGAVPYRKMIEAKFEVTNAGKEELEFLDAPYIEVVKGCCPPSPVLGKKSLAPGETTTLSVSFMMFQGMGGPHDFRVHMKTNDPTAPDRTVQVLSDWK